MESYSSALRSWLLNFIELKKCWSLIRFFLYFRRAEQLELYDSQKFRKREYLKIYDWVNSGMKYVSLAVFWTLKKYTQRWLYSQMVMVKRNVNETTIIRILRNHRLFSYFQRVYIFESIKLFPSPIPMLHV